MPIDKNSLSTMPVWIQLPKLKMEYWGEKSLRKIAGLVGNVIKLDKATSQKARLRFARVLVELNTNEEYPEEIHFTNVQDELITQKVIYEWNLFFTRNVRRWVKLSKIVKQGKRLPSTNQGKTRRDSKRG